jgi:hypothetical protein
MAPADLVRGLDPLVGLGRRHADVHDRDIGLVLIDGGEQFLRGGCLRDDLDASLRTSVAMPSRKSRLSSAITTRTAAQR